MSVAIRERLEEADARFARIVHVEASVMASAIDSDLAEFFADRCEEIMREWGVTLPDDEPDGHALAEWLSEEFAWKRPRGWIIEVETPTRFLSGGMVGSSWGMYGSQVVYGTTYDEAAEKAMAWAEKRASELSA